MSTVEEVLQRQEEMAYATLFASLRETFKQIDPDAKHDFGEAESFMFRAEGMVTAVVVGRLYIEGNATPDAVTVEGMVKLKLDNFADRFNEETAK